MVQKHLGLQHEIIYLSTKDGDMADYDIMF